MKSDLNTRKAQWARFHAWEAGRAREAIPGSGESVVRVVGEIIELYMRVSGRFTETRPTPAEKAAAIRQLHRALRLLPPM